MTMSQANREWDHVMCEGLTTDTLDVTDLMGGYKQDLEWLVRGLKREVKARERARAVYIILHECEPTRGELDDLAGELIEGGMV